jgi:hypothetical protein
MNTRKIPLRVVDTPAVGVILEAPPVLVASEHSVDYTCGRCGWPGLANGANKSFGPRHSGTGTSKVFSVTDTRQYTPTR